MTMIRHVWLVVIALGASAPAQVGEQAVEIYLAERGMNELLAIHLQRQLDLAPARDRVEIAERLGTLYALLLEEAADVDERRIWEDRSRDLLAAVPGAQSYELRLNLAKVRYLGVEGIVERSRLKLTSPAEEDEARRVLRDVRPVFSDMGRELHRRVEQLENQESRGRVEDWSNLERALADARRLRSLAMYYAGWSEYYLSVLTGNQVMAEEALSHFGWLLNAEVGRSPELERLPLNTLRYEHVARAAIGTALCYSARDDDDAALDWLDAVMASPDVSAAIKSQILARRLVILAQATRWADMQRAVELQRRRSREGESAGLTVGEARLLAVLALEAMETGVARDQAVALVRVLAETALADLVNAGEVGHVLSLVNRYGTAPIGDQGFIVLYVRGLQAYDQARKLHEEEDGDTTEPSSTARVANRYVDAAEALLSATASADASTFAEERANAGLIAGYAMYYADRATDAADLLEATFRENPDADKAEDALWLAIVALDRAVTEGATTEQDRLAGLATLYLGRYPHRERAARLLLIKSVTGVIDDEEAVEILLDVDHDAPIYESARRQAARLLYRLYRRAPAEDRDFAALRFVDVGEQVLAFEEHIVTTSNDDEEAMAAGERIVALARQLLDAMLGLSVPDVSRTEPVFQSLQDVSVKLSIDTSDLSAEIIFRQLQVALARNDVEAVNDRLTELRAIGGRYSSAADRLMYRRAFNEWSRAPHEAELAGEVVGHGLRLLRQFEDDAAALEDPIVFGVHDTVASAAATVWRLADDEQMMDIALSLDEKVILSGRRVPSVLSRFAELAEAKGRIDDALDAWRTLLSGYEAGSEDWYEARYQSIRLLLQVDQARARTTMDQHKVLYPEFGPEPWGEQLRQLDAQIPAAPTEIDAGGGG